MPKDLKLEQYFGWNQQVQFKLWYNPRQILCSFKPPHSKTTLPQLETMALKESIFKKKGEKTEGEIQT